MEISAGVKQAFEGKSSTVLYYTHHIHLGALEKRELGRGGDGIGEGWSQQAGKKEKEKEGRQSCGGDDDGNG